MPQLSLADRAAALQRLLIDPPAGYAGKVDGELGDKSRAAFTRLADATLAQPVAIGAGAGAGPLMVAGQFTGIIDVNHANRIDLEKLKAAGFAAIIHKASQGVSYDDGLYQTRKEAALAMGFLWGAYHFATGADGRKQSANFLGDEAGSDPKVLCVLDFEPDETGPDMTLQEGRDWIHAVADATGRMPMIYGGGGLLRDLLEDRADDLFAQCPLWLCDMREHPRPILPNWPAWTLLQYTDGQGGQPPREVPGSDGADRNSYPGTLEQLRAAWPFTHSA
ncbi:MAG TPA: glycoside hydrolase family 25 protein [Chthoniobacteraceae bacterium]|jgi:lysozyme|nr:glycoside hydrolase family 25 protein [Chthoniobacteraceae bacterium]